MRPPALPSRYRAVMRKIGKFHEDDRAQRLLDIFPRWADSQLNLSYVNSTSHIVAWHAHRLQTDFWICLRGSLKVGLVEPQDEPSAMFFEAPERTSPGHYAVRFEYLSDKNFRVLEIPPGVYHGYRALQPGTILLYHLTRKYDPTDEIRAEVGAFNEEWGTENK